MQATSRRSRKTSQTSPESPLARPRIVYSYTARLVEKPVVVSLGVFWPKDAMEDSDKAYAMTLPQERYCHVWLPWEHATLARVAHEGLHVATWVVDHLRSRRILAQYLPRPHYAYLGERPFAEKVEEAQAVALSEFMGSFVVAMSQHSVSLSIFDEAPP